MAEPPGSPRRPLTDAERWEKFSDCLAAAGIGPRSARHPFAAGLDLEQMADLTGFWAYLAAG